MDWAGLVCGAVLAAGAIAAYGNSFGAPFVWDDPLSIVQNPTIRHLWPIWGPLRPLQGTGTTVEGRPLLNLSLAANYAISGTRVWSYHAVNVLIHAIAGLALFGIVRRTVNGKDGPGFQPAPGRDRGLKARATPIAFAVALLWTLHPLQTEAVTYIVQRAESLMGLLYLLTLYCFIRGEDDDGAGAAGQGFSRLSRLRPPAFSILSVVFCFLGMATKEVMVSAPVIVFLYDRTFLAGGFRVTGRANPAR